MSRRQARPRPRLAAIASLLVALVVAAPLLSGCGTQSAGSGSAAGGSAESSGRTPVNDPGKDGVRVTSVTLPPASPSPSPSPSDDYIVSADSLPGDAAEASADYEVTNSGTENLTYTVIFTFMSADGGAMGNPSTTVRDVGPGKTVRGTVRSGEMPPSAPRITSAKVLEVTAVPSAEAPAEPGVCPASGVRVGVDRGDAAMGLRVVSLHLTNCGTRPYSLDGYPLLELLDDRREPVDGVKILDGTGEISTGLGSDVPPESFTLAPGESATAGLAWRNTTQFGTPVNVPYVRVRAKTGTDPVIVTPSLDLGTTGKLGVGPWRKTEAGQGAAG
ncbi:DUF4232 domain-containing protein [Streptomyces liangshanensis]|uniref:DUF4232 domain-containing protein n=1 Tax=Streptomyces liangshanensis TaxID=2717324 RepID=UPI0036DD3913